MSGSPVAMAWRPPSGPAPALAPRSVHVWCADLDLWAAAAQRHAQWLTGAERQRVARLRDPRLRARALAARGLLRELLGRYAGVAPAAVRLEHGPRGKPFLAGETAEPLHFNLSHAGGVALYALTRAAPVGVDVEACDPSLDVAAVAGRVCTKEELALLERCPEAARRQLFCQLWTRKEAFVKGTGAGLTQDLARLAVCEEVAPGVVAVPAGGAAGAIGWWLHDLHPCAGHAAALAVAAATDAIDVFLLGQEDH